MAADGSSPPAFAHRSRARDPIVIAGALVLVLALAAVLLGAGGNGASSPGSGHLDGIVARAQQGTVVFAPDEPFEGRTEVTFEVRPRDAPSVDVQHLQQHSAQGLRTRLYYERDGDRLYAVGQEDLVGQPGAGAIP